MAFSRTQGNGPNCNSLKLFVFLSILNTQMLSYDLSFVLKQLSVLPVWMFLKMAPTFFDRALFKK